MRDCFSNSVAMALNPREVSALNPFRPPFLIQIKLLFFTYEYIIHNVQKIVPTVSASMISLMNSDVLTRPFGPKVPFFTSPPPEESGYSVFK